MSEIEEGQDVVQTEGQDQERVALEAEAKKYGWRAREESDIPDDRWVDADRFMELPSTQLKASRDQNRELSRKLDEQGQLIAGFSNTMREAVETSRRQERERAEQEYNSRLSEIQNAQRTAVENGDVAAYEAAERQRQQIHPPRQEQRGPASEIVEYRQKNEWAQDPALWDEAARAVNFMPNLDRATPAEQMAYAEATMKRRYPHMFQQEQPQQRAPSRVDGGGLGGGVRRDTKGWDSLPVEAKAMGREFIAEGTFKTEADYAKAFYSQGGQ
ncbi:hypothetical protein [Haematobacter sp. UBA3484]|uniref:hypothetical protein n=1 Tax=Haematobacter sp. UBA3484 TaxID=1946582 RepID=UPI0025C6D9F5|nr:hypothetical protein [Haematobacter sp. UBA3484]